MYSIIVFKANQSLMEALKSLIGKNFLHVAQRGQRAYDFVEQNTIF